MRVQILAAEEYDSIHPLIKTKDLISAVLYHKIMHDPYRRMLTLVLCYSANLSGLFFPQQKLKSKK